MTRLARDVQLPTFTSPIVRPRRSLITRLRAFLIRKNT